jgi:hypothetical protein
MEFLLIALAAGLGLFGYEQHKKAVAAAAGGGTNPQPASTPGPTDSTGTGPTNIVNPPIPKAPPGPSGPLGPGVYPPGTAGAFPILVQVVGGDGDSYVTAAPGGDVGPTAGSSKTFWYGPGTRVVFSARVDGFAPFTAFDHFEGPGVSTHSNPIVQPIGSAGFVRGVFAFMGRPGG